jgi:flavin-dependent dehydrogenase
MMYNTAIVVGGSISGLLSAHVLAPHCARVVVVDKDDLHAPPRVYGRNTTVPDQASMAWRRGVPQSCQPHQLTAGGALALNELLPGFHDEVVALGGVNLDLAKHVYYFDHEGRYPNFESHLRGLGISRPFLEQCVRDRVYREGSDKISVVQDTLLDFETEDGEGSRDCSIRGVRLLNRGLMECDLYVDAAGRSSILPALLGKHGLGRPEKLAVDAKIRSASRLVKIPDSFDEGWKLLVIKSLPSGTKGGSLLPMEGGVWQVTLADAGGEPISLTDDGFLKFAEHLPDKKLYDVLRVATPLTDVVEYKAMRNEKLLFDGLDLPAGLLPIGDSVQRLNPIYGQVRVSDNMNLNHIVCRPRQSSFGRRPPCIATFGQASSIPTSPCRSPPIPIDIAGHHSGSPERHHALPLLGTGFVRRHERSGLL